MPETSVNRPLSPAPRGLPTTLPPQRALCFVSHVALMSRFYLESGVLSRRVKGKGFDAKRPKFKFYLGSYQCDIRHITSTTQHRMELLLRMDGLTCTRGVPCLHRLGQLPEASSVFGKIRFLNCQLDTAWMESLNEKLSKSVWPIGMCGEGYFIKC